MAILKMEAVTLAGRLDDFERVVSKYVIGRDIHLENAFTVLRKNKKLYPYSEDNEYSALAKSFLEILSFSGEEPKAQTAVDMDRESMHKLIDKINSGLEEGRKRIAEYEKKAEENKQVMIQLESVIEVDADISRLFGMEFMEFRFGRMSKNSFQTLVTYLEQLDTIFVKTYEDEKDVWGFYFMPKLMTEKVDAVFASLFFERKRFLHSTSGTPKEVYSAIQAETIKLEAAIEYEKQEVDKIVKMNIDELSRGYNSAKQQELFSNIRKKAAHTKEFFYVIGWMPKKDAKLLEKEIEKDDSVVLVLEKPEDIDTVQPPTKLKNIRLFRPFEFFVKMYGLPAYGELDPTPILAITYILLFGIMFGDIGQSAVFAILGYIIYKKKKIDLAAIVSMVGVSGIAFGFVYGSIFGDETLLEHIALVHPLSKINFMLISSVILGICIIIFCMGVNIYNAVKMKNKGRFLFSPSGVAGLMFYGSILAVVAVTLLVKDVQISMPIAAAMIGIPFLAMYLQEPLSKLVEKRKDWKPEGGMFFVESFFEMFDVVLSFMANTISFVRVGAFAIIHVGMMMVVGVLAEGAGAGGSIVVRIIGNIIVMGLEGLIVGIQVLRLEYYEMFSRYFTGGGKEFVNIEE